MIAVLQPTADCLLPSSFVESVFSPGRLDLLPLNLIAVCVAQQFLVDTPHLRASAGSFCFCPRRPFSVDFCLTCLSSKRLRLQDNLDAVIFLLLEHFITPWRIVQAQTMSNYKRGIDLAVVNSF
jgi:hypothetical protein